MNELKNREKKKKHQPGGLLWGGRAEISGVSNLAICLLNPHTYSPDLL